MKFLLYGTEISSFHLKIQSYRFSLLFWVFAICRQAGKLFWDTITLNPSSRYNCSAIRWLPMYSHSENILKKMSSLHVLIPSINDMGYFSYFRIQYYVKFCIMGIFLLRICFFRLLFRKNCSNVYFVSTKINVWSLCE